MNLPPISELSLYKLTQEFSPPLPSIFVSGGTIKSLVNNAIELLIQQQLSAKIWAKLPPTQSWNREIARYQQQQSRDVIYLCIDKDASSLSSSSSNRSASKIIPIELETSSQALKQEYFFLILSSQFCFLILAQQQKVPRKNIVNGEANRDLKMVCTSNSILIQKILAGIKSTISPYCQEFVRNEEITFSSSVDSALLENLLLKQIEVTQKLEPNSNSNLIFSETITANFLGNWVQEVQQPLTNMKTALRLLESAQIKRNQRQRYLELLDRECARQNSLIDGLLELVQLDRFSQEKTSLQFVGLEELIPSIVSTYQPLATERGIQLGYTIARSFPPLSCPSNWLRQIILHLLNNSLKYTLSEGKVSVFAAVKKEFVQIVVKDTGIGIENSDLPKIFAPFFRGKNANCSDRPGAGLGLTIVKQILDRCKGKIFVTSEVGIGSNFTVLLPTMFEGSDI